MPFVNFHIHAPLPPNQQGIVSHSIVQPFAPVAGQFYSVGMHPYDLPKAGNSWLEDLKALIERSQVVAVGECGIDHSISRNIPIEVQTEIFEMQIALAEEYRLPLIIHAVRSYFELIYLRKKHRAKQPWIIHGYNGNLQTTHQLLQQDFLFSIGEAVLNPRKQWAVIINTIPKNRLLVETDDSYVNVELIYERLSELYNLGNEELKAQVKQNFINVLKK